MLVTHRRTRQEHYIAGGSTGLLFPEERLASVSGARNWVWFGSVLMEPPAVGRGYPRFIVHRHRDETCRPSAGLLLNYPCEQG